MIKGKKIGIKKKETKAKKEVIMKYLDTLSLSEEEMKAEKNGDCSICEEPYDSWGHNADPVSKGRCCEHCNVTIVWPKRLEG